MRQLCQAELAKCGTKGSQAIGDDCLWLHMLRSKSSTQEIECSPCVSKVLDDEVDDLVVIVGRAPQELASATDAQTIS